MPQPALVGVACCQVGRVNAAEHLDNAGYLDHEYYHDDAEHFDDHDDAVYQHDDHDPINHHVNHDHYDVNDNVHDADDGEADDDQSESAAGGDITSLADEQRDGRADGIEPGWHHAGPASDVTARGTGAFARDPSPHFGDDGRRGTTGSIIGCGPEHN